MSALVLLLSSPSQATAALVSAAPASLPPATPENACTAFLSDGSESRIGLLCHNDPVNKSDPTGLADNIFVQIANGMAYIGRGIIDAFSTLGSQAVAEVGDHPGEYMVLAATMGGGPAAGEARGLAAGTRASEGVGPRGLGNPFKGKTPGEAAKMMEGKGFEKRGPNPESGKGGYVNPKNDRSYHIDPNNRHGEPPHVDVNRPKNYDGPLEKKKLPLKEGE